MPSRAALSAAAHAALEMLDITCGITLYNPSSPLAQNEGVKKSDQTSSIGGAWFTIFEGHKHVRS